MPIFSNEQKNIFLEAFKVSVLHSTGVLHSANASIMCFKNRSVPYITPCVYIWGNLAFTPNLVYYTRELYFLGYTCSITVAVPIEINSSSSIAQKPAVP